MREYNFQNNVHSPIVHPELVNFPSLAFPHLLINSLHFVQVDVYPEVSIVKKWILVILAPEIQRLLV